MSWTEFSETEGIGSLQIGSVDIGALQECGSPTLEKSYYDKQHSGDAADKVIRKGQDWSNPGSISVLSVYKDEIYDAVLAYAGDGTSSPVTCVRTFADGSVATFSAFVGYPELKAPLAGADNGMAVELQLASTIVWS